MMKVIQRTIVWVFGIAIFGLAPMLSADATTAPSVAADQAQMRPGPRYVIQRYKTAIGQLTLTDDQKSQIQGFFDQANQQGLDLSQKLADAQPGERYQLLVGFSQQLRGQLAKILTDDQMQTVDQKVNALLNRRPNGAGAGPATRPGGGGNGLAARGAIIDAMRQALGKVDLSDDQKQEVDDLLKSAAQQMADLRAKMQAGQNVQQDIYQLRQSIREKLQSILTDDQMQAFTQALQQARQDRGGAGPGLDGAGPSASSDSKPEKPADLDFSGPEIGAPVPSVPITETNGHLFVPSKYKGHVLVIEFGSMSCPVFREHAAEMEKLRAAEQSHAFFLIVYTREAFPAGDKNAERNKEEGVSVLDATNLDDRKAQAIETQRELRITIPMAVDSMDNSVSKAYGGFPNGAVVIGKDGTIAAHQQWTNPDTLRMAIDDAFSAPLVAEGGN